MGCVHEITRFSVGLDAVQPFLVSTPNETYDRSLIKMDVMLGVTSEVWCLRTLPYLGSIKAFIYIAQRIYFVLDWPYCKCRKVQRWNC